MKITVYTIPTDNRAYPIEVSENLELENFKGLCEMKVGILSTDMEIGFNFQLLKDNNTCNLNLHT